MSFDRVVFGSDPRAFSARTTLYAAISSAFFSLDLFSDALVIIRVLGDLVKVPTGVGVRIRVPVVPDGELSEESDPTDSSSEPRLIVSGLTGSSSSFTRALYPMKYPGTLT